MHNIADIVQCTTVYTVYIVSVRQSPSSAAESIPALIKNDNVVHGPAMVIAGCDPKSNSPTVYASATIVATMKMPSVSIVLRTPSNDPAKIAAVKSAMDPAVLISNPNPHQAISGEIARVADTKATMKNATPASTAGVIGTVICRRHTVISTAVAESMSPNAKAVSIPFCKAGDTAVNGICNTGKTARTHANGTAKAFSKNESLISTASVYP